MESYYKQLHIRKVSFDKIWRLSEPFWDKMYTLFGSAPKSALRSQRVKGTSMLYFTFARLALLLLLKILNTTPQLYSSRLLVFTQRF